MINDKEKLIKKINEIMDNMCVESLEMEYDRLKSHREVQAVITMEITNEGFIDELFVDEADCQDLHSAFDLSEEMKRFVDSMEKDLWDCKVAVIAKVEMETDTTEGIQEYTDWLTIVDFYILDRELSKYHDSEEDCFLNDVEGSYLIDPNDYGNDV